MQVATLTHAVSGIRPLELSPLYWLAVTFGNFLKTAALTLDSHHPWGPQGSDLGVRGHPTPRSRVHVSAPPDYTGDQQRHLGPSAWPSARAQEGPLPSLLHTVWRVELLSLQVARETVCARSGPRPSSPCGWQRA